MRVFRAGGTLSLALCTTVACGGSGAPSDTADPSLSVGSFTTASTESGTTGGTDSDGASGEEGSNASQPIFDVGNGEGGADVPSVQDGCQKVDVIFAVDNSGSMSEEHAALEGPVFDAFPEALLDINNGIDDFQLGVIDACPKPALFHNWGTGGACNFSTGTNYMISSSPALVAEFACVSTFAVQGYNDEADACIDSGAFADDDEQPGFAAAESVSAANLAGANLGFVRDDAILFVVGITDEDEELVDIGSVNEIHDRLIAAKNGDVASVVYLGIAGGSECNGPYGSALNAVNSQALAGLFVADGQGLFWDLCQGNLETAFQTAISTIVEDACQGFEPPG